MYIEIYGASWCAACNQSKQMCETNNANFNYVDIDDTANFRKLEEKLGTKPRSVPQIFIDNILVKDGLIGLQTALNIV